MYTTLLLAQRNGWFRVAGYFRTPDRDRLGVHRMIVRSQKRLVPSCLLYFRSQERDGLSVHHFTSRSENGWFHVAVHFRAPDRGRMKVHHIIVRSAGSVLPAIL